MNGITNAQSAVTAANKGITAIQSLAQLGADRRQPGAAIAPTLVTVTGTNSSAFTTGSAIASTAGSATRLKTGDTVTVSDGTTTATYTAANGDTIQTLLNAINDTANLKVTASLNSSGQLQFAATSNVNVTIGGTDAPAPAPDGVLGLTAGTTNYTTNTSSGSGHAVRQPADADRPGRGGRRLQRHQSSSPAVEHGYPQRDRHVERHHHRLAGDVQRARAWRAPPIRSSSTPTSTPP